MKPICLSYSDVDMHAGLFAGHIYGLKIHDLKNMKKKYRPNHLTVNILASNIICHSLLMMLLVW